MVIGNSWLFPRLSSCCNISHMAVWGMLGQAVCIGLLPVWDSVTVVVVLFALAIVSMSVSLPAVTTIVSVASPKEVQGKQMGHLMAFGLAGERRTPNVATRTALCGV